MTAPTIADELKTTALHARTAAANRLSRWHSWKGWLVADSYADAELEYFACRNAATLFDLSPMSKYLIAGSAAHDVVSRLVTRSLDKLVPGRVAYVALCDDAGQLLDDGTLFRLSDTSFRLCTYGRHLAWLADNVFGFDAEVTDVTTDVAAIALQGPTSYSVLQALGLDGVDTLRPYRILDTTWQGTALAVSRTGFTGDLGYELWIAPAAVVALWDALCAAGEPFGVVPMGTDALELARIEAGFLQSGVDFIPADHVVRPGRTRSPYELGLGWLVDLGKPVFNGRAALAAEHASGGGRWTLARLDVAGNKPATAAFVTTRRGREVGFVTSAAWSPVAKRNIALAHVERRYADQPLFADIYTQRELHWSRTLAPCQLVEGPFWNPPRRRATPPAPF
ncbi:MAG: aminomethyltransferase family protein [Pseudomonadota bacterium]